MPSRDVVLAFLSSLILGGVAVGATVMYGKRERARRLRGGTFKVPLPSIYDLEDFDEEGESDEPPPADLRYVDEPPCQLPSQPWQIPQAQAFGQPFVGGDPAGYCTPPAELLPEPKTEVSFAAGADRPGWPLDTASDQRLKVSYKDVSGNFHGRWGRHFAATRKSTAEDGSTYQRVHVAMDLFAEPGDVVYATEPGEVIATLPFYKGTGAIYVLHDSGMIINYGEIENGSWKDYGIKSGIGTGQRVEKGQAIARVGRSNDGSHMLHLETYEPSVTVDDIRAKKMRWYAGSPAPAGILDPTLYLVRAQRAAYEDRLAAELAAEQT